MSVVTVCFNARATITDTIESVRRQDYPALEHIIMDGGSTDGTMEVVSRHAHERLIAHSERDHGIYDAMNRGLARATGDIVGFLNADDYLVNPGVIRHVVAPFAADPLLQCVSGEVVLIDQELRTRRYYPPPLMPTLAFHFGHMPPHPATYVRRALLKELGGFDTSFKIAADFDLLARLLVGQRATYRNINRVITAMRIGGLSTAGLSSTRTINQEILRSCRQNGITTSAALIWSKYFFKWTQLVRRPRVLWNGPREW